MTRGLRGRLERLVRQNKRGRHDRCGPCGGYGPEAGLGIAVYDVDEDGRWHGLPWVASGGCCNLCYTVVKAYSRADYERIPS